MIEIKIAEALQVSLKKLYDIEISVDVSQIQKTRKEFEGDFTIVVFPYVKLAKKSPDVLADDLGNELQKELQNAGMISFNVIKGFLNLSFADSFWIRFFNEKREKKEYGRVIINEDVKPILIEFSSPNTNKPLHLGHVRNNLLGSSIASILQACGKKIIKVNLVNDRGIHICKSMAAWLKYGHGETPELAKMKGDHLVGKYYVEFDKHYKAEIEQLKLSGLDEEKASREAPLMKEAREMLTQWERGDEEVRKLWAMMNGWVYEGFAETYKRLGVQFDKTYYESETYLLGKDLVNEGLKKGVFTQKEDGSVWVDLTGEGLDEKLLLRSDGTSVYITQDLGTAEQRYKEYDPELMIYVVGNEQIYHFDVLKLILSKKLGLPAGEAIYHLSYGMVELPQGKMKSREGTVVDADDLMEEMFLQAKASTEALGKTDFSGEEAATLYEMIGEGALKYFILKVDPKKNMLFNPEESIDFNGNTAPFIQYTHARICSLLRKAAENNANLTVNMDLSFLPAEVEKALIRRLYEYPQIVQNAGESYSPALIANYIYDLAKEFNAFYQETPIFKESDLQKRTFRLQLSQFVASVIKSGMSLLGIDVPERM